MLSYTLSLRIPWDRPVHERGALRQCAYPEALDDGAAHAEVRRAEAEHGPVQSIPRIVSATGYQELQAIGRLAARGGVFVAAVPLLILACIYLPWRVRASR